MNKSGWIVAASAVLLVAGIGHQANSAPGDLPKSEVQRGLAISPVNLKLRGLNRDLVGRGSYIINAQGGCNDCHTFPSYAPGGNPFAGEPEQINKDHYLSGGMPFGPPPSSPVSRNLTPDATGKPAGMTFQEFKRTLRTGRDLNGNTLRIMPWPVYGKMTDQDIRAVYEFLRAIPRAEPGTGP